MRGGRGQGGLAGGVVGEVGASECPTVGGEVGGGEKGSDVVGEEPVDGLASMFPRFDASGKQREGWRGGLRDVGCIGVDWSFCTRLRPASGLNSKGGGQTGLSRPGAGEASELSVLRINSAPSIH